MIGVLQKYIYHIKVEINYMLFLQNAIDIPLSEIPVLLFSQNAKASKCVSQGIVFVVLVPVPNVAKIT